MRRRSVALLLLNPGRIRRLRDHAVELDAKTKRVLRAAAGGAAVPRYWIGLPWRDVVQLERALRRLAGEGRACARAVTCYQPSRDRRGRRRPCRKSIRGGSPELLAAFNAALDGQLGRAWDYLDEGSPVFSDLRDSAGRRGRRIRRWADAVRLAMPRSRRWRDVDPAAVRRLSEYFEAELERNGRGRLRLELPLETRALLEEEQQRAGCDDAITEQTARELRRVLERDAVPF